MARTAVDAERSLARYLSEVLPDWDIWTIRTLSNEERPYAVVKPMMVPQAAHQSVQIIDITQPFIVYMYPEIGKTALGGRDNVYELLETLYQAFFVTNAKRVPMYDYTTGAPDGSEIPWSEVGPTQQSYSAVDEDGNPAALDYYRVTEYQANQAQDADDERRWSVTLTLRLAWRRHGKILSAYPVTGVKITSEIS